MEYKKEQQFFEKNKWFAASGNLKSLKILERKEAAKYQHSQANTETCVIKLSDVLEFADPICSWALASV